MDFKQLEAYVKVLELASFSKAAEAIFLSQPSVSGYVGALERELGAVLLNRSTKEISPTPAGKLFYESAVELLALRQRSAERLAGLTGNLRGDVSILSSTVPSQYILPGLVARFRARYPDITLHITQADTLGVARGVASKQAELGVAGGIVDGDKCSYAPFLTEKLVVIAPPGGEFSPGQIYEPAELLLGRRFIAREQGSGTRAHYERFLAGAHVDPGCLQPCASFDNTQSVLGAVAAGLGVSMVSGLAAREYIERGDVVPLSLSIPLPERTFYRVLKKNIVHSHLAELFANFLQEME